MGLRRSFKPTNLLYNTDFRYGTSGWNYTPAVLTIFQNTATLTAVVRYGGVGQNCNFIDGRKYYMRGYVKADSSLVLLSLWAGVGGCSKSYSGSGNYELLSAVGTYIASTMSTYQFIKLSDSRSSDWTAMSIKEIMIIDLTSSFGTGSEPTKAWCDANIPEWFDGTLSGGIIGSIGGLQ